MAGTKRSTKTGLSLSEATIKAMDSLTSESGLSRPALIEKLVHEAYEYQLAQDGFAIPFKVVSKIEYQRFLEFRHLLEPANLADLTRAAGHSYHQNESTSLKVAENTNKTA